MSKPLFLIKKSWTDARVECKKNGGDLVSLETPEENYCLRYILYINGDFNNKP
jgi:Lectin C-type domain